MIRTRISPLAALRRRAVFGADEIWPTVGRYYAGGPVSGPGHGLSDSIVGVLSRDEYVVPADPALKNRTVLDAMRSGQTFSLRGTRDVQGMAQPVIRNVDNSIQMHNDNTLNIDEFQRMVERMVFERVVFERDLAVLGQHG